MSVITNNKISIFIDFQKILIFDFDHGNHPSLEIML